MKHSIEIVGLCFAKRPFCSIIAFFCLEKLLLQGLKLEITFVPKRQMRLLNKRFRGVEGTTDVLAWKGETCAWLVLCLEKIASYRPHMPQKEAMYKTLIHGLLHLAGHDHGSEAEEREMKQAEKKIYERVGQELGLRWSDSF